MLSDTSSMRENAAGDVLSQSFGIFHLYLVGSEKPRKKLKEGYMMFGKFVKIIEKVW